MVEYHSLGFPRSFNRSQVKSTSLLALSFLPLCGCFVAVILGFTFGSSIDKQPLHLKFQVPNYHVLNNALSIMGIYHSLVGYGIRKLMDRVVDQFRTRAYLNKSASTAQILNTLPGTPDWTKFITCRIGRIIRYVGLFSGLLSIGTGVLYKQGIVLSTFRDSSDQTYPFTFVTGCTTDFTDCIMNRYLSYGVALQQARSGGAFTKGVEKSVNSSDGGDYRLTFVATPTVNVTSWQKNITHLSAKTFAMVSDFRNVSSGEVLPTQGSGIGTAADTTVNVLVTFHGTDNLDWSFSVNRNKSGETPQRIRGFTRYCIVDAEWTAVDGGLLLESYRLNDSATSCSSLRIGAWSELSGLEIAHSLLSDIRDGHRGPYVEPANQPEQDALESAYVVPAMYAVVILAGLDDLGSSLSNDPFLKSTLSSPLNCLQDFTYLAIETTPHFLAYFVVLFVIFIAHWISGFVDTKVFVTDWAPLWLGLLSEAEQEDIKEQIRENYGMDGLEEIGSRSIPLLHSAKSLPPSAVGGSVEGSVT